jgi:hypothetical protein
MPGSRPCPRRATTLGHNDSRRSAVAPETFRPGCFVARAQLGSLAPPIRNRLVRFVPRKRDVDNWLRRLCLGGKAGDRRYELGSNRKKMARGPRQQAARPLRAARKGSPEKGRNVVGLAQGAVGSKACGRLRSKRGGYRSRRPCCSIPAFPRPCRQRSRQVEIVDPEVQIHRKSLTIRTPFAPPAIGKLRAQKKL